MVITTPTRLRHQKAAITVATFCPGLTLCHPLGGELATAGDSATLVAAVPRSLDATVDHLLRRLPEVRGQAQEAHEVDEGRGEIELDAELAGGVVEGERVMVVVEAFAWKRIIDTTSTQ